MKQLLENLRRIGHRLLDAYDVMAPHWLRFFKSLRHPLYRNDKGQLKTSLHDLMNIWVEFCGTQETKWLAGHIWMLQTVITIIWILVLKHQLSMPAAPVLSISP